MRMRMRPNKRGSRTWSRTLEVVNVERGKCGTEDGGGCLRCESVEDECIECSDTLHEDE